MKIITLIAVTIVIFIGQGCRAQRPVADSSGLPVAFPGAEGFGKFTTGGRGGKVFVVTTLADSGRGSFREAAEAKMPRIIVFAVAGTIHLQTNLVISKNVTIAGQTAPGDGICLADRPVGLGGDNIIVRYLRFRMGDRYQRGGMIPGNGGDDAFGGTRKKNIIIDHCSVSWSTDECLTVYGGDSTTLQWNIISEPLNYSYHFEEGDKDYERHGFGGIWGGKHLTAHHNLFAHCVSRNPRFNGARLGAKEDFVDFRQNVIYNWGGNNVYGGEGGNYNVVNNYYKAGPATSGNVCGRIVNPTRQESPFIDFGKFYVSGNFVAGFPEVTADNRKGVHVSASGVDGNYLVNQAFPAVAITENSALSAFEQVLLKAGSSLPARDTLDIRITNDVRNGSGRIIDVQGGFPHGTPYEATMTAWPFLRPGIPLPDSDGDGMPDEWEKTNKLNANDPSDASIYTLSKVYTNIEVYINSLGK